MTRNMTDNVVPYLLDVQIGNCLLYQLYKEIKCQCCVVSFVPLHPSGQKTILNKLRQVCVVLQENSGYAHHCKTIVLFDMFATTIRKPKNPVSRQFNSREMEGDICGSQTNCYETPSATFPCPWSRSAGITKPFRHTSQWRGNVMRAEKGFFITFLPSHKPLLWSVNVSSGMPATTEQVILHQSPPPPWSPSCPQFKTSQCPNSIDPDLNPTLHPFLSPEERHCLLPNMHCWLCMKEEMLCKAIDRRRM